MTPITTGILLVLSLAGSSLSQAPACPKIDLPSQYNLKEKVLSWTTTLDVTDANGSNEGQIVKKLFSWGIEFDYTNQFGQYAGQGHTEVFSWGKQIDLKDCQGNQIGGIKEDILKSLFKISTVYTLTDGSGQKVAESDKFDLGTTDFTIRDIHGSTVATLHRPFFNLVGDVWQVNLQNVTTVEPLTLLMIGAFKTDADDHKSDAVSISHGSALQNLILSLVAQGVLCGVYFF
jgi:uncharacterized protein YxjI